MYLIVGLGNPGAEYARTRHNIGFMLIDRLAEAYSIKSSKKGFSSTWGRGRIDGEEVVLAKPDTYMNLSGTAVRALMKGFDIEISKLLIICDDCELPHGRIRIRKKGGSGGQKGLASTIELVGTKDFSRLRMGIGAPDWKELSDYVLSPFSKAEQDGLEEMLHQGSEAVLSFIKEGPDYAMNKYNAI